MAIANDLYSQFQKNRINIQEEKHCLADGDISAKAQAIDKSKAFQQYQNSMVNTASPQELTLMLYNGLIKFLNLAKLGIEEKSIEKTNNYLIRSQDIVQEFMNTLDMSYEVSKGLIALYDYMNTRLIEANIKKDKAIVEEVLMFAEQLRDTWSQAMKLAKQQNANKSAVDI